MNDPFTWSIQLVRCGGFAVRLHLLLLVYAAVMLLDAALTEGRPVGSTICWLGLLLLVLVLHELGHWLTARILDVPADPIRLWPLGNFLLPRPAVLSRSPETLLTVAAGLATSGTLALLTLLWLRFVGDAQMVLSPFGQRIGGGTPVLRATGELAPSFSVIWWAGWFGYLNWVVFLANLIPALPMDMGRIVRGVSESGHAGWARDRLIGPWTARVTAVVLILGGVIRLLISSHGGLTLVLLGVLIYMVAWIEARMADEPELYEDTLFGYDFSQGYTSLEASAAAAIRPPREGMLTRWRRRRAELRRRRQEARALAEAQRMDQLLDKIHRDGRSSLTHDEQRFLVRVSARYRSRVRSRD